MIFLSTRKYLYSREKEILESKPFWILDHFYSVTPKEKLAQRLDGTEPSRLVGDSKEPNESVFDNQAASISNGPICWYSWKSLSRRVRQDPLSNNDPENWTNSQPPLLCRLASQFVQL